MTNCIRYLGYTSIAQVDALTIPDYLLLMEGVRLREVDTDYRIHELAYLTYMAKAEKKAGKNKVKPVYDRFDKFYDYEAAIREAKGLPKKTDERFLSLSRYLKGKNNGRET